MRDVFLNFFRMFFIFFLHICPFAPLFAGGDALVENRLLSSVEIQQLIAKLHAADRGFSAISAIVRNRIISEPEVYDDIDRYNNQFIRERGRLSATRVGFPMMGLAALTFYLTGTNFAWAIVAVPSFIVSLQFLFPDRVEFVLGLDSASFKRTMLDRLRVEFRRFDNLPRALDLVWLSSFSTRIAEAQAKYGEIVDKNYISYQTEMAHKYWFKPPHLDEFLQDYGTPMRRIGERAYLVSVRLQIRNSIRELEKRLKSLRSSENEAPGVEACWQILDSLSLTK